VGISLVELTSLLSKVNTIVGDAPVVLHSVESAVESTVKSIGIELGLDGDASGTTVTITHSAAAPATASTSEPAAGPDKS